MFSCHNLDGIHELSHKKVCSNLAADHCLCFRYIDSTMNRSTFLIRNCKSLDIVCGFTARVESDLVGNPEDRFSHDESHDL